VILVVQFYFYAVLVYALLSWFAGAAYNPAGQILARVCEPLLAPIRRVIPPLGGLDLSALFLMIGLQALLLLLR
jgi:YggT family protein